MVLTLAKDYDYVRNEVDLPRLSALNAYYEKLPPVQVSMQRVCLMLESFFGIETEKQDTKNDEPDLIDMLMQFPQG